MHDLAAYLRTEARRPFALGSRDCATFVTGWVAACRGAPVAYPDATSTAAAGPRATVRAWRASAAAAGIPETHSPRPGDVAVIRDGGNAVGAILTPRGWARVRDRALVVGPARPLVSFSIGGI